MKNFYRLLFAFAALNFGCSPSEEKTNSKPQPGLITENAMVVSAHPLASRVGAGVMKQGGNAVDAAIATHFALAVVFPAAGNIGGGGFMVLRTNEGLTDALDFRETAPGSATRDMYLDEQGEVIEDLSTLGHLASGVPGSVDGMFRAYEKYGSLPWKELVQPAIDLAINGFPLTLIEANGLNHMQEGFQNYNTVAPGFLLREWKEGDTIRWEELGATLTRIRDKGRDGFYTGQTADDIVMEMHRGKGLIDHEDLENYRSVWRTPVTSKYKRYKIISMPPPSSGGIALIQLLKSAEPFDVKSMRHNTAPTIHLMTEAERRVYADRATHLGDPDFYDVPLSDLLQEKYIQERMSNYTPEAASSSDSIQAGAFAYYESEETTHFSVVDPGGMAVSVTTTLNRGYGSGVVVAGSGFLLNNEMDDFSIKPGFPNLYGLIGGEANAIMPEKRMLSSMTPTILEKTGNFIWW